MSRYLTPQHTLQLSKLRSWDKGTSYRLLFSAQNNGHTPAAFHAACDNKGPTIVLIKLVTGELFGGFTSVNWDSSNSQAVDNTAFLFRLGNTVETINVTAGANAISRQATHGPIFGTTDLVLFDPATSGGCSSTLTDAYAHPSPATALAGKVAPWGPLDVEVLQVLPSKIVSTSANINFSNPNELRAAASSWIPTSGNIVDVYTSNILIVGGMATGKSSLINTLITALSDTDTIRRIAVSRQDGSSVTTKLGGFDLRALGKDGKPLANAVLLDTAGWTATNYNGMVDYLLKGQIRYNNTTTIGDKNYELRDTDVLPASNLYTNEVHCVVFVFPYDKTTTNKDVEDYNTLVQAAYNNSIPRVGIITHCDEDPVVQIAGLAAAYSSPSLAEARSRVAGALNISRGEVLLVKNYNEETQPIAEVNAMALFALRVIQRSVDNYLDRFALGFSGRHGMPKKPHNPNN